jgi:hypothetical protein
VADRRPVGVLVAVCALAAGACSSAALSAARPRPAATSSTSRPATAIGDPTTAAPAAAATTTSAAPAVFTSSVSAVSAAALGSSWRPGCPVGPDQLRSVRLAFWGFDGRAHTGSLVVHATVTDAVTRVFRSLFEGRFPIRRMDPVDAFDGSDPASMAADNTSAFNCRNAVTTGPPSWSVHAYGKAIDVNPVENPYLEGGGVQPPAGSGYIDRADVRPGMAAPAGPLVTAFVAAGWQWGGRWSSSPDYQHFSSTGG